MNIYKIQKKKKLSGKTSSHIAHWVSWGNVCIACGVAILWVLSRYLLQIEVWFSIDHLHNNYLVLINFKHNSICICIFQMQIKFQSPLFSLLTSVVFNLFLFMSAMSCKTVMSSVISSFIFNPPWFHGMIPCLFFLSLI